MRKKVVHLPRLSTLLCNVAREKNRDENSVISRLTNTQIKKSIICLE